MCRSRSDWMHRDLWEKKTFPHVPWRNGGANWKLFENTIAEYVFFFLRLEHEVEMVVVKTLRFIASDTTGGISFSERKKL